MARCAVVVFSSCARVLLAARLSVNHQQHQLSVEDASATGVLAPVFVNDAEWTSTWLEHSGEEFTCNGTAAAEAVPLRTFTDGSNHGGMNSRHALVAMYEHPPAESKELSLNVDIARFFSETNSEDVYPEETRYTYLIMDVFFADGPSGPSGPFQWSHCTVTEWLKKQDFYVPFAGCGEDTSELSARGVLSKCGPLEGWGSKQFAPDVTESQRVLKATKQVSFDLSLVLLHPSTPFFVRLRTNKSEKIGQAWGPKFAAGIDVSADLQLYWRSAGHS